VPDLLIRQALFRQPS